MTFTPEQVEKLSGPLNKAHVKPPAPGKYGDYIEGWRTIDEANRIFGFDGWSRETLELEEVCRELFELTGKNGPYKQWRVSYRAKVRVTAGGVTREGTGFGSGAAKPEALGDAIESAGKEAETDAMKRALMTFGNPFGLALYDKTQSNVVEMPPELPASVQMMITGLRASAEKGELAMADYWKQHWPAVPHEHRPAVLEIKEELKAGMALVSNVRAG